MRGIFIKHIWLLILAVGLALPAILWPQQALAQAVRLHTQKQISQFIHDTWSTDDGLPQNSITAIVQDDEGYLWLGTQEGLVRTDGIDYTVFDKRSTPAFRVNDVVALLKAQNGDLWIGTRGGGAIRYAGGEFTTIGRQEGLESEYITALSQDRAGNIWLGTYGGGLSRFYNEELTVFSENVGFSSEFISQVTEDGAGNLWIGTEQGLFQFVDEGLKPYRNTEIDSAFVTEIYADAYQNLWIATQKQGLYVLSADSLHKHAYASFKESYISSITQDHAGSLWFGMANGSLVRLTGTRFERAQTAASFAENDIISLLEDKEGSLWVGTRADGLHRLRNGNFTPYATTEGLVNNQVYTAYEQEGTGLWVGTAAGLGLIKENSLFPFPGSNAIAGKEILSIEGDGGPGIWLGTWGEGLFYKQGELLRQFTTAQGLVGNNIFALKTDSKGRLWIGTDEGVGIYDGTKFSSLGIQDGLPSLFITAIEESKDGAIWIGTYDAGLIRYNEGHISHFSTDHGLASNGILSLYEDIEGVLWIGTYGGGLSRMSLNNITTYTTRDGLFNDNIYVILEDNENRLWMSCNKGIFSVDKSVLKAVARGDSVAIISDAYDKRDGLRTAEATGGQQPAGWKAGNGTLWFPTIEGIASLDPHNIQINEVKPEVIIEHLTVDSQELDLRTTSEIEAGAKKLHFEFTATSLVIPKDVTFQYKLEGLDADWSAVDSRREAFYNNLPPGNYTFRVRAANNDGVWNEQGTAIAFYLKPLFYQTLWFKGASVFMVLLLGFIAYRVRIQQLKARQLALENIVEERTRDLRLAKEKTEESKKVIEAQADRLADLDRFKTRFFANISHEFRTPLTMIIGPLENAIGGAYGNLENNMKRQVGIMLRNAQRLLRLINQLLDLSKLEAGKMELRAQKRNIIQFLEGVLLSCTPLAEKKNITLTFNAPEEEIGLYYEPDKLEKVFFNLLSNALKFTPESGTISFDILACEPDETFKEGAIEVRVKDTGRGIPKEDLPHIFDRFHQVDGSNTREFEGTGIGLALVHELVMLHHGTINVESEIGAGTTFIIHFPLGNKHLDQEQVTNDILGDDVIYPSSNSVISELATESISFDHESENSVIDEPFNGPDPMIGSKVVLIVDDNNDVREYVSGILSEHFVVHTAVDGVDGLEKTGELKPDLIISDVMMPRMDGNELCRRIKQNLDFDHIPVILMTARATNELRIAGLELGADDYIAKPFNARELLVRARNLMIMRHQEKELKQLNENLEQKVAEQLSQMLNERLKYEEELLTAKEKAEASSRLKSTILDNVNHEFRTPIAGIMGSAEILEMEAEESMKEFVGFIKQSAYRLQNTLDAVLELSHLESEDITLNCHTLNFTDLVRDLIDRYKPLAINKGLQFYSNLQDADIYVYAEENALQRILDHIIDNAIKFTHDGQIQVNLEHTDGAAVLSVVDTGIGISAEFMPRLFDAFVQESDGVARSYEGIGIGLTISKRLVELMDGELEAASVKNEGTTLLLKLPLQTPATSARGIADEDTAL